LFPFIEDLRGLVIFVISVIPEILQMALQLDKVFWVAGV
jgi:hypothetical protein